MPTRHTLVITRHVPPDVEARATRDYEVRLEAGGVAKTAAQIVAMTQGADALLCSVVDPLGAETINALPDSIRVISTFSVGYDHIALDAAKARGIAVCNTPDVLSVATAEIAMLLMLSAGRRASEGERLLRAGQWRGWAPDHLMGLGLSRRRLGIFGMGRIGREIARMARGFEMEIHYRNRNRLPPELEQGAVFHDNDTSFLGASQVLALSAASGASTRHWLNAERIALLPKDAIVVNTGRGPLVDDDALIAALESKRVAYAGLDVYNNEPNLNPGYLKLENVTLLPHLGSATIETRNAMGFLALDGIDAVLAGRTPANRVV